MDSGLPPGIIASSGERSWNFLSLEGHAVQCAANGYEAFRLIVRAQTRPALIFLDLLMPVLEAASFSSSKARIRFLPRPSSTCVLPMRTKTKETPWRNEVNSNRRYLVNRLTTASG
jgi:hypothetical protein